MAAKRCLTIVRVVAAMHGHFNDVAADIFQALSVIACLGLCGLFLYLASID